VVLCKARKWCLENKLYQEKVTQIEDFEELTKQNTKLECKLVDFKQVTANLKDKQDEIAELEERVADCDDIKNENKDLQQQISELKKVKHENEDLKEKVAELEDVKNEMEDLKEKVVELADVQNENADLKEKIAELVVQQEIIGGKEPIHLIFCGGSMLQETNILALPHMKMDIVIKNYCSELKMPITKFVFYTKPQGVHGKKVPVNYEMSAHDNGYVNGTRILIEKAQNNSLWNRGEKDKDDDYWEM